MSCWSESLYSVSIKKFGKQVTSCREVFNTNNIKDISLCLSRNFKEEPEKYLSFFVKESAILGIDCLNEEQEKQELHDQLIFICKKYEMLAPEEVHKLLIKEEPKNGLLGRIKSIFKK